MNNVYYKQILNIIPDKPNILALKVDSYISETWPVILKKIIDRTETTLTFEVSDLKNSILCEINDPEMMDKVSSMHEGQIIFLYDSIIALNKQSRVLEIKVNFVYTLKEVNDGLVKPPKSKINSNKRTKSAEKKLKDNNKSVVASAKKQQHNSNWRTLAERWKCQGKT